MKAFLLAAGYGTRLKPITDQIPKCLAPIQGRPLLGWWMELFRLHGVTEVLVNTHYRAEQVAEYIDTLPSCMPKVQLAFEPKLLGSGGTVKQNMGFVSGEADFFICYADNLTAVNLSALLQFHRRQSCLLSMGLFHAPQPEQCGIVELDENAILTAFEEKPQFPKTDLANAGIYVARPAITNYFPDKPVFDFGFDVLPSLLQHRQMNGCLIQEYLLDIGTLATYERANREWSGDYLKNPVSN